MSRTEAKSGAWKHERIQCPEGVDTAKRKTQLTNKRMKLFAFKALLYHPKSQQVSPRWCPGTCLHGVTE